MTDISKLDETIQDEDGINQCSEGDISYADEKMNNDITNCTNQKIEDNECNEEIQPRRVKN